jgi:hypothetical protein
MRGRSHRALCGFVILAVASSEAFGQSSAAQITGVVADASGAILPGVDVSVTQTETGLKRSTITSDTGMYVLPNLPVGPYRLEATLPGFRTYARTGLVLQVGSNGVFNVSMEVGQLTETIDAKGAPSTVAYNCR